MENYLPTKKNEDFQIFDFLFKYIKQWHWFLISVGLCCCIAFLKIKSTPKTYQCTATVLIIEDDNSDISAGLNERSQFKAKANVNNEIDVFMSPQLVQEVVKRLNLNVNYAVKERFMNVDLYTQSPIVAVFPDSFEQDGFSFQVELKPDSMVILSNFDQWGTIFPQSINAKLNVPTQSPIGTVVISPSLYYSAGQHPKPVIVSKNNTKNVALGFAGALDVSLMSKEKTVIVLNMEDVSYQRAEDFLTTLILVYNENFLREKNKTIEATLSQINEQLPIIEEELKILDGMYASYKSTNRLTDTRDAASLYMKESSEYKGKIIEINNQIAFARSIRTQINDNSRASEALPANVVLSDPAIEASISEYNALIFKRNELIAHGGGKNPVIEELNNKLGSLRRSILNNVENLIRAHQMRLSSLRSQENTLVANIASNPGQEKDLRSIERELNIKEQLYIYLLQQRQINEMSRIVTPTNSQVINPPSGSGAPAKPSKRKILMAAFMIGMCIPFGVITVQHELNTLVRDEKDVAHLPVPVLGIIPHVKKRGLLFVEERGRDALNESFRVVRSNLDFICKQENIKVVQFTSMESYSGKTFIAVNLAMSIVLTGKKVVLVDLDLRTAALSKLIDHQDLGISISLTKPVPDERPYIEKDFFHPGLDVIPAGPVPVNPSDLLMSQHLKPLIENLRTTYDYIFIDGTHTGTVADAVVVGQFADLNVFVVRKNHTDRRKLPKLIDFFHSGKFKNMHIVLNDVTDRHFNKKETGIS